MKYDYLIIGTGLAGATCAALLAHSGASVLAIDRADLVVKDKLCGGLLTPRALAVLKQVYGHGPDALFREEHHEMRVMSNVHDRVVHGFFVRCVRRRDLDRYAVAAALAEGAEVVDRTHATSIDFTAHTAVLDMDGTVVEVEFGTLIAADGATSATRKAACTAMRSLANDRNRAAIEALTAPAELVPSIEAYVKPSGQPLAGKYKPKMQGYCWYAPCDDVANIGCGGAAAENAQQLYDMLTEFAADMDVEVDLSTVRGAPIPSGKKVLLQLDFPGTPTYFLGDAAGLVAPATSEGIYFALVSAQRLARSLTSPDAPRYHTAMFNDLVTLRIQGQLMKILFNENIIDASFSMSHKANISTDTMAHIVMRLFASF